MKKAKIIVLSGQSNAVGVGHVKCLSRSFSQQKTSEYLKGYENIKINYCSHDKKSNGFTVTKNGCTELTKDTIGPEVGIADYLNENFPGEEFFIVKFAVGGTTLKRDFLSPSSGGYFAPREFKNEYKWFIDAFFSEKPIKAGWCYNGLVSLVGDSIEYLNNNGYAPEIIGFCWMQGESDACELNDAVNYKVLFENFINDFKREFSQYLQNCIFVDAGILDSWPFHKELNDFKRDYAKTHKNFVYFGTIENGLTTHHEPPENPDLYHHDCASVIKLGKLFIHNIINQ